MEFSELLNGLLYEHSQAKYGLLILKYILKFILIAALGLIFSFSCQFLSELRAQEASKIHQPIEDFVLVSKKYYNAGQFSEAVKLLQEAAYFYQVKGNSLQQAQTLSLLSLGYQQLGQATEAEAAIKTSLSVLDGVTNKNSEFLRVSAGVLNLGC
jgi:tetratricopeptide (TPR) repeat protein